MTKPLQTLEDLRQWEAPAVLWDVARARLVWANEAAIKAFAAQSLFDLIDRPFDVNEPAFAAMAEAQRQLARGQTLRTALDFPSLGRDEPFTCDCRLHTLADGRDGILAITPIEQRAAQMESPASLALLDQLPLACLALTADGTVKLANGEAFSLLGDDMPSTLAALLGEAQAASLRARMEHTRLVSMTVPYASAFGQREARLTLQRLTGINNLSYLLVLEDVTDRRELERMLTAGDTVPAAQSQDQQVFEHLGRAIAAASQSAPTPAAPVVHEPEIAAAPIASPIPLQPSKPDEASQLRAILDICADGIVTMNEAGTIQTFSAGAEAIFGYRGAEVLGEDFVRLLSKESGAVFSDYLSGLNGRGLASVFNDGREVTGIVKQGGQVPLFLNLGRLPDGKTYCAVLRDNTALKRHEGELSAARDAAEESNKHKTEFLANVSHELRTPLTAILGFSDIMRHSQNEAEANAKFRAYANDIHASGSHLLSMVDDLLDMSRIESGRMELDFTAVSLADCFAAAQRLLQDQAIKARVLIRKSFPDNLPRVVADARSLRQILTNLLSNAVKYTDAGGEVVVSARLDDAGDLALKVQDSGIGMNRDELARALQPFSRIETPGRQRAGTGLGLPLTKALAEANRAAFDIKSERGKGTAITITFPTTRVLAG